MLKLRSLISQLCGIFPYTCLLMSFGCMTGFQIVLIAELYKENSEIPTTLDQLSWFASLEIVKTVFTLTTGFLMHRLGSQPLAFIAALLFITSGFLYYYASTITVIFASRLLYSLIGIRTMCNSYVSEISEPQYRGTFFAICSLIENIGTFIAVLLGSLMYWRTIALVNLIFPVLAALTILATPNSPIWLARKGRLDKAEKSLCWLRGWVKSECIQNEFDSIAKSVQNSSSNVEVVDCQEKTTRFFQLFIQRSFYIPLCTMCLISSICALNGITTIESYSTVIFHELESPIEESVATAIMGSMSIFGSFIILLLISRTGKRKLVFFSVIVTGLCQAIVAAIGFSNLQKEYLWIPPIAVIVAKFANYVGIGSIAFMLPAEIFPSSVRYIGTSITIATKMFIGSIVDKLFLYAVEAVTLEGVFLFFTIMNFVGLFIYYFLVPETEGRSLSEIEDQFKNENKKENAK